MNWQDKVSRGLERAPRAVVLIFIWAAIMLYIFNEVIDYVLETYRHTPEAEFASICCFPAFFLLWVGSSMFIAYKWFYNPKIEN